ncbi:MAG: hypothetical protein A2747_03630 [Candidatus Yonathbacteria bacterium RIFCSPHIGHO2_01_FULL_44_41]|uniref:Uncharacterized protein n=1 Tax=Candidatus Yonathbacteria bacterium RIFCSPHIGHO2_02_FULL_44_14 TaxID=1802724 RepID=A0A1G2S8H3_9BACT|nr:MAG: hypothetical protein A2747_03630 [Candidatus Yonathbacteria bacterium RIFCSPHIGHO2_01_FULL_44_41]OHA80872.1 MAG: hypothetical protein A3D51_00980 [Candidatus Yonathbacteria bacterium RIFCSPHIGHO2_02_FULL_44_14]OHA81019.1 MAG: hypothetical protein A3B06_03670 [Candidatus Yonathbacteria bacterium RIFCSPLOWO2_01_FULL_43_20]
MKNTTTDFLLSLSLVLGMILCLSPFLLYWFIHIYDGGQYYWVIQGPFPFSHMGSFAYQIVTYISLFVGGVLCVAVYLLGKENKWKYISLLPLVGVVAVIGLYVMVGVIVT